MNDVIRQEFKKHQSSKKDPLISFFTSKKMDQKANILKNKTYGEAFLELMKILSEEGGSAQAMGINGYQFVKLLGDKDFLIDLLDVPTYLVTEQASIMLQQIGDQNAKGILGEKSIANIRKAIEKAVSSLPNIDKPFVLNPAKIVGVSY